MKPSTIIKKEITIRVCNDVSQLTKNEQRLIREAQASVGQAYAPYSNFKVGSANSSIYLLLSFIHRFYFCP